MCTGAYKTTVLSSISELWPVLEIQNASGASVVLAAGACHSTAWLFGLVPQASNCKAHKSFHYTFVWPEIIRLRVFLVPNTHNLSLSLYILYMIVIISLSLSLYTVCLYIYIHTYTYTHTHTFQPSAVFPKARPFLGSDADPRDQPGPSGPRRRALDRASDHDLRGRTERSVETEGAVGRIG